MGHTKIMIFSALLAAGFAAAPAIAKPPPPPPPPPDCPASGSCSVDGVVYTETGVSSGDGLTFLATFDAANQSNSTIAADVLQFLAAESYDDVTYLGRQDGTGTIDGDHISTSSSDDGLTGTWTLSPGTTNDIGAFVAIHAGDGKSVDLFEIDDQGLSGTWATLNGHGLSNFDLFGIDAPLPPPGNDPPGKVPEPLTLSLFGSGLAGAIALRRRKRKLLA